MNFSTTSPRSDKSSASAAPTTAPASAEREENPALCDHEYRGHFFDNLLRRLPKPAVRPTRTIRAAA